MKTRFLCARGPMNLFRFACECCGAAGELELEKHDRDTFACPEGCGATYVQYADCLTGKPALKCVCRPIRVEAPDKPA